MNDYKQRLDHSRQFEPTTTSMGRFFSNRIRDSLNFGGALTTNERETFDQTSADCEATPDPPISLYDLHRNMVTPSSTSSINESYFMRATPDIHKFSRRVELSSGYNILKNRNSSHPTRLPANLQGRTPLAQLNPLPIPAPVSMPTTATMATTTTKVTDLDENRQRRLSLTDQNRAQHLAYAQQILQQYNADGIRRPFSSDSPVPPALIQPTLVPKPPANIIPYNYPASAPLVHTRTANELIEPLKLISAQEDNSIAALSRELRAAAYPTTRKSSNQSPTRETSPSTVRHSNRTNAKRAPPLRALPKLHENEQQTAITSNVKINSHLYHRHEPEKFLLTSEDRLQSSSSTSLLVDQFFHSEQTPRKEPIIPTQDLTHTYNDKSNREQASSSALLIRNNSASNMSNDTTMSFVSKYARLAPIQANQISSINGTFSGLPTDEVNSIITNTTVNNNNTNNSMNHIVTNENHYHYDQTIDTLHDLSIFHNDEFNLTDNLLEPCDMTNPDVTLNEIEDYSYVPLKEDMKNQNDIPLLELDELETNSDISESQLVPIIYAKDLANEIDLLQKAHLLKQQQRSMKSDNENDRMNDNNSVPPPANMELLNFEALEDEQPTTNHIDDTPLASPTVASTLMEISSPLPLMKGNTLSTESSPHPPPSTITDTEVSIANMLQHSILAHNRLSSWFKLPTELWFKILPYLNINELHNFSYTCKRFHLLAQDHACRHRIIINRRMKLEQCWFDGIARRKPISLSFIECRQKDLETDQQQIDHNLNNIKWLEFFQSIGPTLLEFTMSGCYHEPFTLNTLLPILVQTCPNMLSINLHWNNIKETTLNHLINYSQMVNLKTLDLTGCQILDDTLLINIFIRSETDFKLEKLVLRACTKITWTSLDAIAICLPNLIHLDVSRCIGLKNVSSDQNSTCFKYWPKLEYINLSNLLALDDNDFNLIFDNCTYLHTLIIDDCINLTDQIFNRLTLNFKMISLNNCTNFSTNILLNLNEQCPYLETINVNHIRNLNDQCLLKWSEKPFIQLRQLSIDHCTECRINSIEIFIEKHLKLQNLSLIGNIVSNGMERERLRNKFSNIKFVFQ